MTILAETLLEQRFRMLWSTRLPCVCTAHSLCFRCVRCRVHGRLCGWMGAPLLIAKQKRQCLITSLPLLKVTQPVQDLVFLQVHSGHHKQEQRPCWQVEYQHVPPAGRIVGQCLCQCQPKNIVVSTNVRVPLNPVNRIHCDNLLLPSVHLILCSPTVSRFRRESQL